MDVNKNCTVCNMKLVVVNYLKHRTVCKTCYNRDRRQNSNNTAHDNQKWKLLIAITVQPQPSSDEVLELVEVIKSRVTKSTSTWNS